MLKQIATGPTMQWTPPYWFLWLMRVLRHPSMKKVARKQAPHDLPPQQRSLFHCVGRAIEHANARHPLRHEDHLRVLEMFRYAITENWVETQPDLIPHISKLLGKD